MSMSKVILEHDGQKLDNSELFAMLLDARDNGVYAVAVTFSLDFCDTTITDLDKYRKAALEQSHKMELKRCAFINSMPGAALQVPEDAKWRCINIIKAMSGRGKWAPSYNRGVRLKWSKDVVATAQAAMDAMGPIG